MFWSPSNLRREFDWLMKRWLRWSAPVVRAPMGDVTPLVEALSPEERGRYDALAAAYDISGFGAVCTLTLIYQCLNRLDLLDQHLGPTPEGGLDVGALNWTYLPALAAFQPGPWPGYELDGYQRYVTMDTRAAQGRHMAEQIEGASYQIGSILDVTGQWGLVTWFLPYVTRGPLVSAGLPNRFYDPEAMLRHVWTLVAPGGSLFVMNVDDQEDACQAALFEATGIPAERLGLMTSVFDDDDDENHGWVARKPASG